jgi:L-lactate utilization protein LutC
MTTSRESFLQRVREAVAQGNRAGAGAELPERGTVGYQGAGPDPIQRFCSELTAAGGVAHVVPNAATAANRVLELVTTRNARRILLGRGPFLDSLNLAAQLRIAGLEVIPADAASSAVKDDFYNADLGISAVEYLIGETGSVVVASRPGDPRSVSLLPPVHIAVASHRQLLPDMFDLFAEFEKAGLSALPSGIAVITGPSKTGDIELKLVTGVHGPGEVHVVLME